MTINEITEQLKSGDIDRTYEEVQKVFAANPDDKDTRIAYSMCVKAQMERAAKAGDDSTLLAELEEYANLRLEEIGEKWRNNKAAWDIRAIILKWKETGEFDPVKVRRLYDAVTQIDFEKPHRYYSILLDAFLRIRDAQEEPWVDMPEMIAWWGLENLLEEDYRRHLLTNGQSVPSLAERAYTACYKCLMRGLEAGEMRDEAESFIGDLEVLEESHPEFRYVMYQKTRILKALGHTDLALVAARGAVRCRRNDFWSWSLLGDLAETDDEKAACYSRALMCRTDPGMLVKVRRKLAALMYRAGYYANARREFEKIISIYGYKGWPLPSDLEEISHQQWFEMTPAAESNRGYYQTMAAGAENYLNSDMPETPVLITRYNPQKQTCSFATSDHRRGFFSAKRLNERFADNQIYLVRFDGEINGDKISNVTSVRRATDLAPFDGIFFRQLETELNLRPGMSFLFVDNIYVDGTLLRGHRAGERAIITAVLYYNMKKDSWGWRAIRMREA